MDPNRGVTESFRLVNPDTDELPRHGDWMCMEEFQFNFVFAPFVLWNCFGSANLHASKRLSRPNIGCEIGFERCGSTPSMHIANDPQQE